MNNNSNKTLKKVDEDKKLKLESSCKLWVALFLFIGIAIFLPTYLGIIGLLFSNVAIPIIVFSAEAIFLTLIIILILSIRNIYRDNNLLQGQIIDTTNNQEEKDSIDKNKILWENNQGVEYKENQVGSKNSSDSSEWNQTNK